MPTIQEIWEHVQEQVAQGAGCWDWTGPVMPNGYGRVSYGGEQHATHRVSYVATFGRIPQGMEIDHLCRNQICVNPSHLEAVTHQVNVLRGVSPLARRAGQTHCKHGHELDAENTYVRPNGQRVCRPCKRRDGRAAYARRAS